MSSYQTTRRSLVDQCESMMRPATAGGGVRGGSGTSNPQTPSAVRSPFTGGRYPDNLRSTPTSSYRRPLQSVDVSNVSQSLLALQENARTHAAELEMERNHREIAIKELSNRSRNEVGELREMIKQLRADNTSLKETMWTMERNMRSSPALISQPQDNHRMSYFGGGSGSGSESRIIHHDDRPLIPRVHDLETALEKLKRTTDRLHDQERNHEERLDKIHIEIGVSRDQATDDAKQFSERQSEYLKDLIELEKDVRLREMDEARNNLLDTASELRHECNTHNDAMGRRVKVLEEATAQCTVANTHVSTSMAKLEVLIETSEESSRQRSETTSHQVKQEVEKQARQLRDERIDGHQELLRSVTQKVDVATATLLSREEFTRFQKQIVADMSSEVDTANKHAQQARVTAEDARRELTGKIATFEATASDLALKIEQTSQAVKVQEQVGRSNASEIADSKGQMRLLQTASEGLDHQQTKLISKVSALEETTVSSDNSLGRLKALVESQHHTNASEREQLRDRVAATEGSDLELRKDIRTVDNELASVRILAERALSATTECNGAISTDRGLGGEASKRAQSGIEAVLKSLNDFKSEQDVKAEEIATKFGEVEKRMEGGEKRLGKRIDELSNTVSENESAIVAKVVALAAAQSAAEKAMGDVSAQAKRAATQEQLAATTEGHDEKIADLQAKVEKNRKEITAKVEGLQEVDAELATKMGKVETAAQITSERVAAATNGIQRIEQEQDTLKDATAALKEKIVARKDPAVEGRFENLEQRIEASSASGKQSAELTKRRMDEVSNELRDMVAEVQSKQALVGKEVRDITDDLNAVKDDNINIQELLSDAANGIRDLSARADSTEHTITDIRSVITSRDDNMDAIENALRHIDEELKECVDAVRPLCEATGSQPPEVIGQAMGYLASSLQAYLDSSHFSADQTQSQALALINMATIVDRHEVGFASMGEILEAIKFVTDNITTIADRVGLEKEKFQLRVFEESDLRSVIDHAAQRSSS